MKSIAFAALFAATIFTAQSAPAQKATMNKATVLPAPPSAEQRPYSYERHGIRVEDPWHWLKDQSYPDGR